MGLKERGWRVSEPYFVAKNSKEVEEIAAEMRAHPTYKKREATTFQTPEFYESLEREARGEKRDWNAPLPESAIAVPGAKNEAEAVGGRLIEIEEMIMIAEMRQRGHGNTLGESKLSSASDERKAIAAHHLIVSPPVKPEDVDPSKIVGLTPIKSEPPPVEVWKKLPAHKAVWHWLTGNKVKRVKND